MRNLSLLMAALAATSSSICRADDGRSADGMPGAFGSYGMTREASGTSWQPETTPMDGIMFMSGDWMFMFHGYLDQVHDRQGGPQGDSKDFSESMFMGMAQRPWGDGTVGLRSMFSLDPLMGKDGYPLLLQTGETADGLHPLVDRQHPHDLFMELSASYSHPMSTTDSVFVYAGLPGEPALGPPTFMHRASGMDDPEAPITHHWLDSTHVTFGVLTFGYVHSGFKLDASAFHGREPDQSRWNIETGRLDSASVRATWDPDEHWSLQASRGYIYSPEQLEPSVNQRRTTASAMYDGEFGTTARWDTTFAWGQDDDRPGHKLDAWLAESEVVIADWHTFFFRAERAQKDELFTPGSPLAGQVFDVGKVSGGYIHDWPLSPHLKFGLGGLLSLYQLSEPVRSVYDSPHSYMLFARLKLD